MPGGLAWGVPAWDYMVSAIKIAIEQVNMIRSLLLSSQLIMLLSCLA
jgi:hypothetical protein